MHTRTCTQSDTVYDHDAKKNDYIVCMFCIGSDTMFEIDKSNNENDERNRYLHLHVEGN